MNRAFEVLNLARGSVAADQACAALEDLGIHVTARDRSSGPTNLTDVVITDRLEDALVQRARCGTVVLSPFGHGGPRAAWKANSQSLFHVSGLGYVTPRAPQMGVGDEAIVAPTAPWGCMAERVEGSLGAVAVLALSLGTTPGAVYDISGQECLLPLIRREIGAYECDGYVASRYERLWKVAPSGFYAAKDGEIYIMVVEERQWRALCDLIGRSDLGESPDFSTGERRFQHFATIEAILSHWVQHRDRDEIFRSLGGVGVAAGPVLSPGDLLEFPPLLERRFVSSESGFLRGPVLDWHPAEKDWRPLSPINLSGRSADSDGGRHPSRPDRGPGAGPLSGVRVVEFTHVWAGPLCGQFLADLGADVIRVESRSRIDVHRRAGPYAPGHPGDINASAVWNAQNRGKRSCVIDILTPDGRELARRLALSSDILVENFRPGVMSRLGLGYEDLSSENPELVYVSLSGFGQSGTLSHFPAYGPMLDAMVGLAFLTRDGSGRAQSANGWLPDVSGGIFGAMCAVWGLLRARHEQRGGWLDVAEIETGISLLKDAVDRAVAGISMDGCMGNVDAQGGVMKVLPTRDEDGWIAIRLEEEGQEREAVDALGAARPAALEVSGMDGMLRCMDGFEACEILQSAGIEAVPVQSSKDLLEDQNLRIRGAFVTTEHAVVGWNESYAAPLRPVGEVFASCAAPAFGEHTGDILREWLNLNAAEISVLEKREIVGQMRLQGKS